MSDMVEGWHFLTADRRLGYGDGREVVAGETLTVDGTPELCRRGLHASQRAIDALRYAQGFVVSRVRLTGVIVHGDDKACATERTTLWLADAREVVLGWACWCAWGALLGQAWRGRKVDTRSIRALKMTEALIAGQATMEEARDARIAAAAIDAAPDSAYAAAAAAYAAAADVYAVAAAGYDVAAAYAVFDDADADAMRAVANEELERRLWALSL